MVDYILLRLLPTQPTSASDFTRDLQGLVITAYNVAAGTDDPDSIPLGTASGVTPATSTPDDIVSNLPELVIHSAATTSPPQLETAIMQHVFPKTPDDLNAGKYASVATAVVLLNVSTEKLISPLSDLYIVKLALTRNGVPIGDSIPEFSLSSISKETLSTLQTDYTGLIDGTDPSDGRKFSPYVFIPPAGASGTENAVALDAASRQPPLFSTLVDDIDHVLEQMATHSSKLEQRDPLSVTQSRQIASALVSKSTHQPIPAPGMPLESMYTLSPVASPSQIQGSGLRRIDQARRKFEANYKSTYSKKIDQLATFVYAASAAIYAEKQTATSPAASFTFPVAASLSGASTMVKELTVLLKGDKVAETSEGLKPLDPSFVVPAAFFYALGTTDSIQTPPEDRYKRNLNKTEEVLRAEFTTAKNLGTLQVDQNTRVSGNSKLTEGVSITLEQAARRIIALGSTTGSLQPIDLTNVSRIVSDWLAYSGPTVNMMSEFWDPKIVKHSDEYLDLILKVIASGNIDLVTAIKNQFPQVSTADDLLTQTDHSKWKSLFVAQPDLLPESTNPGNSSHRTEAFIRNMKTILAVPTTTPASDALEPNDIPILEVSGQDSLAQFLQNYPGGFDFSADLNDTTINQTLSQLFLSNPTLQARTKVAIETIHTLYSVTGITTIDDSLHFSLMEALYARGFTTAERITVLTQTQFASALRGSVAYQSDYPTHIYTLAGKEASLSAPNPDSRVSHL